MSKRPSPLHATGAAEAAPSPETAGEPQASPPSSAAGHALGLGSLASRHLKIGWWSLLVFLSLGIVLEALHGLKIGFYLDVTNETRRLMWTLAHAHGTLLALVHLAFAGTLALAGAATARAWQTASLSLTAASVLIPAGFFFGGVVVRGGDPGYAIVLLPIGAGFLFLAVALIARQIGR